MFLKLTNADINIACLLNGRKQLYALLSHQTLSVIAPIFLKSLSVKLPDGMSQRSFKLVCEILRVPIFVRVSFILSIRNLDLQIK